MAESEISASSAVAAPRLQLERSGEGIDSAIVQRVRLYLKITFIINALLTLVTLIVVVSGGDSTQTPRPEVLIGASFVTAVNGMAWFLMRRGGRSVLTSTVLANLVTVLLTISYTHISTRDPYEPNPTRSVLFAELIVSMVLVLRSSLIPSPAIKTTAIGVISVIPVVVAALPANSGDGWVFFVWTTAMCLVTVAVTSVTSQTVYGMQRRVSTAAQLGQYQLERLLGRGGMGEVYLARHALLQRPTAIKLLRDVGTESARRLFRQEVQTASGLTHPNTVEIYDYGRTPEGVFYFAMEYVEGATLEDVVLATGAMPPERVVHIMRQAASSLSEAHGRGLVHRDIKPSNLMLCDRGGIFDTLKVMDFGLVRDLAESEPGEHDTGLTGTPLYLAPEGILEGRRALPQSDVYALGATAFFLLAGRPPFASGSLVEVLSDHLATPAPRIECTDERLEALVRACLAKDPAERPADAGALFGELERCATAGQWTANDASVWWAEHAEVVLARATKEQASARNSRRRSRTSAARSSMNSTGRR